MSAGEILRGFQLLNESVVPVDLLACGVVGKRPERIPAVGIVVDVEIVDHGHVQELAESIFGVDIDNPDSVAVQQLGQSLTSDGVIADAYGQLQPILLRARYDEQTGEVVHDVIDGFHRSAAFRAVAGLLTQAGFDPGQALDLDAVVVYNISDEQLYDLRILAANSVKSTKFARIAEWMKRSYEQTHWAKQGITLTNAFSVASGGGVRLHLPADEEAGIADWVNRKAKQWRRPVDSILQDLRLIDIADPELVQVVRVGGGGGKRGNGVLNPARLRAIATGLPRDFDMQRVVAGVVLKENLVKTEIEQLTRVTAAVRNETELLQMLLNDPRHTIGIVRIVPEDSPYLRDLLTAAIFHDLSSGEVLVLAKILSASAAEDGLLDAIQIDPRGVIGAIAESGVDVDEALVSNGDGDGHDHRQSAIARPGGNYKDYNRVRTLAEVDAENAQLRLALAVAYQTIEDQVTEGVLKWWETLPNLTYEERFVLAQVMEGEPFEAIAGRMNLLENNVQRYLRSGLRRYALYVEDQERRRVLDKFKPQSD